MHCRQVWKGKKDPVYVKYSRTYRSVLRRSHRTAQTVLDQSCARDPRPFLFSSGSLSWFVDSHPCLSLHLLTTPSIAADIVARYLSPGPIRTAQAHPRISGHERSLTQIKFNKDGDLLFSCSKDHVINVWFSHNGERLGTYDGHNGTVWTIDVDCTSPAVPRSSFVDITNRPHQHNPDFSCPDLPITLSDCGPSSQANACTSGNFPQQSKV